MCFLATSLYNYGEQIQATTPVVLRNKYVIIMAYNLWMYECNYIYISIWIKG